jgi:antitoxin HigA-1
MTMFNPPHPGEVLRDGVFSEGAHTVSAFAAHIGMSRVALSRVLNGHAAVSADLAHRLAAALGGSAQSWLAMQAAYDLWQLQRRNAKEYRRIKPVTVDREAA